MLFKKKKIIYDEYSCASESHDDIPWEYLHNWDTVFCFTKETNFVSIDTNICLLYGPQVQFAHRNNLSTKVVKCPISSQHTAQVGTNFSTIVVKNQTWWLTTLKFRIYLYFFSEYGINDHRCTVLIKSKCSYYNYCIMNCRLNVCSTLYVMQFFEENLICGLIIFLQKFTIYLYE